MNDSRSPWTSSRGPVNTTKHFPVQSVAKASYRAILERRAQENRVDFVEGSGHGAHRWRSTRS